MRRWVLVLVLAQATVARADATVTVTLNEQGRDLAGRLGLTAPELEQAAEARIDELYRISRFDELLQAFANTAAFSQRGLGADYDVDPGDIMFGAGAAAVHGDIAIGTTNSLLGGTIVNFALLGGANLKRLDLERFTVFASGFYEATTIHGIEGELLTLATHAQVQLVGPSPPSKARWTGLALTTGFEYARWSMSSVNSIESHFIAQGPTERSSIHMSSTGPLEMLTKTYALPVELTTGVRLVDVLSLYTGGGFALTAGQSTITAQLDSQLTINSDNLPIGTATIVGSGEREPSGAIGHWITGAAIHTRHVRVFLQGAIASGEQSVTLGVHIAP